MTPAFADPTAPARPLHVVAPDDLPGFLAGQPAPVQRLGQAEHGQLLEPDVGDQVAHYGRPASVGAALTGVARVVLVARVVESGVIVADVGQKSASIAHESPAYCRFREQLRQ